MKVLFITNIPSPYRLKFFKELGKWCELDVIFERATSAERDESWSQFRFENYRGILLKGIAFNTDKAFSLEIIKYLKEDYDILIIANAATPLGVFSIMYLKMHRRKYYIEGDGAQYIKKNPFKEYIKKKIIGGAAGYFSTSEELDQYYRMYGATSKIYRYPFTSVSMSDIQDSEKKEQKRYEARKKLNISEKSKIVLGIGRFDFIKGFDVLIRAMKNMTEAQCYIIGGEPTDEYLQIIEKNSVKNVVFRKFMTPDKLEVYFQAADIFVLPTRYDPWGLVINEAMAYGLPVISTTKCVAATELIENGKNGYVVRPDDVEELSVKMLELLKNEDLCKKMQTENIKKISAYTIENMVKIHMDVFQNILK